MTTLQHKQNPFGLLEHSDSDEDDHVKTAKPKKPTQTTAANKDSKQGPSQAKPKSEAGQAKVQEAPRVQNKLINPTQTDNKDKAEHIRPKEPRKLKGIPAEPHPLDRHSGTGLNPWEKRPKKAGGGKYNVGTIKDELQAGEIAGEQGAEEANVEEAEKDTSITLAEYYQLKGYSQEESQKQVNEAKSKVTQQELLKEIGTAKPLQSRAQTKVDENLVNQKKKIVAEHAVGINTEHADLLGFKTGFRTFTERKLDDQGKPIYEKKPYEKKPEEGGSPQIKPEGQIAPVEGGENTAEQAQPKEQYNKGPRQFQGDRKANPNWKPRDQQRDQPRDQQRDQQREQPRGGRGGDNRPPNFEDEKAFPKLG